MAKYKEIETLLQVGEYKDGSDALADEAIAKIDAIRAFLHQRTDEFAEPPATFAALGQLRG
jgi:type III secretion protein N (ATPase)